MAQQHDEDDERLESAVATIEDQRHDLAMNAPANWLDVEDRVRELYAPECDDLEWQIFKSEASGYKLNPIKREYIPLMIGNVEVKQANGYSYNPKRWRKQYRGYVTQAGMITLAEASGQLEAIEGPFWIGDHTAGQWVEYWLPKWGIPDAARVTVYRKGHQRGTSAVVTMSRARLSWIDDPEDSHELRRREGREKLNKVRVVAKGPWTDDPAMMLGVRATTDALRKSGLLTAVPDVEALRLALDAPAGPLAISAGELEEIDHRLAASRRIHAVADTRGLNHDDIRDVAAVLIPETESLADLDAANLQATADYIEMAPADTLARDAGKHPTEIVGEEKVIGAEPNLEPADGKMTSEQDAWLEANGTRIDWTRVNEADQQSYADRDLLDYGQATRLILRLGRALKPDTDGDEWTAFWNAAREAGFADSKALTKAAGGQALPDTVLEAYILLGQAIAAKAAEVGPGDRPGK